MTINLRPVGSRICACLLHTLILTLANLQASAATSDANQSDLFSIHGSNTIGAQLAPALVTAFLETTGANNVKLEATSVENERIALFTIKQKPARIMLAAHGSSSGFKALSSGSADIWASSRPAKSNEIKAMNDQANLSSADSEHIIAIDGLAIIVHPENPINQLTVDQLRDLFSGKTRNWSTVGGVDSAVKIYARDNKSGTWDTFKSLVLGKKVLLTGAAKRFESNDRLAASVAGDPGGIGFTSMASAGNSKVLAIADGDSPAIKPTRLTVATEDYPLSRRLYFYTNGKSSDSVINEYLNFVHSSRGQAIVGDNGFVEQNIVAVTPEFNDSVPKTFRILTSNYQRLSVNFRFDQGKTRLANLDNKARRDIRRVAEYLQKYNKTGKDLMLIGFADKNSDEFRAQQLSFSRAFAVRKALKKEKIDVKAYTGYGQYMPVAQSKGGGETSRNGRVELWIRKLEN